MEASSAWASCAKQNNVGKVQLQDHHDGQPQESDLHIDVGMTSNEPKRPSLYLLKGERSICGSLYYAAVNDRWETARGILERVPHAVNAAITNSGRETILHIAARSKNVEFVRMLVKEKSGDIDFALPDVNGNTAFCLAVAAGAVDIIDILRASGGDNITTVRGGAGMTPLYIAASFGYGEIASQLYPLTKQYLEEGERIGVFFTCIYTELHGLALQILTDFPEIAFARDITNETALHVLARKPLAFATEAQGLRRLMVNWFSNLRLNRNQRSARQGQALDLLKQVWNQVLDQSSYLKIKQLINDPFPLLLDAAELGNYNFLVALICSYPDLIWEVDEKNRTIFHIAVLNRHVSIFKLIYEMGLNKDVISTFEDDRGNNILHLAARLPHASRLNVVSGAPLQMQQELRWYKVVENIVITSLRRKVNMDNETPQEIFTRTHAGLMKEGEEWSKKTAKSCSILAALIASQVFSATFTALGNNTGDDKCHVRHSLYTILLISNVVAMFSSSASLLVFLSVLISRYAEQDFLRSLPCKLIAGITALLISVVAMIIAFCVASFIGHNNYRPKQIPIFVSAIQFMPIALFVCLVYPLLRDTFSSTFFSQCLFSPNESILRWED